MIAALAGGLALAILAIAARTCGAILRSLWPDDPDEYVTPAWRREQLRGRRHD